MKNIFGKKVIKLCLITSLVLTGILHGCEYNKNTLSVERPVYSKNGEYVYFEGLKNGDRAIYSIKSDGTELKKITKPFGISDFFPVPCPTGKKILFSTVTKKGGCPDLCLMNEDGSNITFLTTNGMGGFDAVFSNDGNIVYFVSPCKYGNEQEADRDDIYSINTDGTDRKKVTNFKDFQIRHLSISPDGGEILLQRTSFDRKPPASDSIWIYPLSKKSTMHPLRPDVTEYINKNNSKTTEPLNYDAFNCPQFSPKGNKILFVWPGHYQGYFGHEIYIMDIKNQKAKKITDLKEFINKPSFSPDGKHIIFTVGIDYREGKPTIFELWKVNIDGTNPHRILLK